MSEETDKSPMGGVILDLTRVIAIASATAYLIRFMLKRG